ncbi:MAG: hypothetical protein MIO92_06870 [Methanosarcinaceae archaeon]|nr:hypothetical protein [Methanosarcinaceae archaeon]
MFQVNFFKTVEGPWVRMEPVRIGAVPIGLGTPEWYVTVYKGDRPYLRVDLYLGPDEIDVFREAIIWEQSVAIGAGHSVFLIHLESLDSRGIELGSYFCRLYPSAEYLLIASAEHLCHVNRDGSIKWTSPRIGIDGVEVVGVQDGIIQGHGQWDPPAGWKSFGINLKSGLPVP